MNATITPRPAAGPHAPRRWRAIASALLALALGACGGGVGEEGTGVTTGLSTVGRVTSLSTDGTSVSTIGVNDVQLDLQATTDIQDGRGQRLAPSDLQLGDWVEVSGSATVDASGTVTSASASQLRVRPAARGKVESVGPAGATFNVLGTTVTLANDTVLDGSASAQFAPGDVVEVHGPLGTGAGTVTATRVQRLPANPPQAPVYELRGRVSQLSPGTRTMLVGRRQVDYGSATVLLRPALSNGQIVRVSSSVEPVEGAVWRVDEVRSDGSLPANLPFLYTEGFVDQLAPGPVFQLEDVRVDASNANGKSAVTANDLRVALFGPRVDGTLHARSVAVVVDGQPVLFTLVGPISGYTSLSSFRVRGVLVDASNARFILPATPESLVDGQRVRVVGSMQGRTLKLTTVALAP